MNSLLLCDGLALLDSGGLTAHRRSFPQRALAPQDVVVVLGEAMGLVADVLQQPQGIGAPA